MAVLAIAGILGAASALAGTGYALSGAGQPTQPNLGASSAAMSNLQARMLPYLRALQAAAEEGGSALRFGYKQTTATDQMRNKLQNQLQQAEQQLSVAQAAAKNAGPTGTPSIKGGYSGTAGQVGTLQQRVNNLQSQLDAIPAGPGATVYLNNKGQIVPASQALADFSGYSQADVQGAITKEMAQAQLELSQKYDPQFIASALEQEKLADPQSFEGRQKLYDLMQEQIKNPPTSPVSNEMENQVAQRVAAGSNLTPDEEAMLNQAVSAGSADRGGSSTPQGGVAPDWAADVTTGFQGEQRALSNAGAGDAWLASGQTPEDILYRSEQQNLANLGNFIRGQTPQAQFRELSGAQQGPTPVTTGGAPGLPTLNPNAGAMGANAAVQNYQLQIQQALGQPNPWMAGLSGLLGVAGTAGAAGYRPFGGG